MTSHRVSVAHNPVRRWWTFWLFVGCRCGADLVGGRCPIDETPQRIGDGDTVPLVDLKNSHPRWVTEPTRYYPMVRRNFLTPAQSWRGNGGRR